MCKSSPLGVGWGGGFFIRVVAANADYFTAVCLDGCHVSGGGQVLDAKGLGSLQLLLG
jgi:hypothetical protein